MEMSTKIFIVVYLFVITILINMLLYPITQHNMNTYTFIFMLGMINMGYILLFIDMYDEYIRGTKKHGIR